VSIGPTLAPEQAARRLWDCGVVGAGPAGAMAARELARRGVSVLLIDRSSFPRYKVCGGCLNPRSLRLLDKAGLGRLTTDLDGVPLTRFRLAARGHCADVPLPTGSGVSREALDAALVGEAVAAGAAFLPAAPATVLPLSGFADQRGLRLRHAGREHMVECRVVLAANGLGGKLDDRPETTDDAPAWEPGSRVGAGVMIPSCPSGYEPHVIYMACGADGYVGAVQVEGGRVDMAAALDPLAVKRAGGPGELAVAILGQAGFPPIPGLARLPWKGTPHLTRQAPRLGGERLFVLGDAAGYVEPFTGEGMAWALAGALLVAPLALRGARHWDPELLVRWRAAYHRTVTRRQIVCRATAGLLRRPTATRAMVQVLGLTPWVARPLFRIMYHD
jgi:flavin-dependent dehydrogenase